MQRRSVRFAIIGLGNVGRRLLELIERQHDLLSSRYRLEFTPVGQRTRRARPLAQRGWIRGRSWTSSSPGRGLPVIPKRGGET